MTTKRQIITVAAMSLLFAALGAIIGRAAHDVPADETAAAPSAESADGVGTTDAPVVAPASFGEMPPEDFDPEIDGVTTGAATGIARVPVDPGAADLPPAPPEPPTVDDLDAPLTTPDHLAAAPDVVAVAPGAVPPLVLAAAEDTGELPVELDSDGPAATASRIDPCASSEDPAADECPEGVSGVVLAISPPLWAFARPLGNPASDGTHRGATPSCPDLRPGPNEAAVAVITNKPSTVELRVGPNTLGTLETHPDDVEAWQERPSRAIRHCGTVRADRPPAWLTVDALVVAHDGSITTATTGVGVGFDDARPPVSLEPVGPNHVRVVAAHTPVEAVAIHGWTVPPGTGRPIGCRNPGTAIYGSEPRSWQVSPTRYLFTERTERMLYVPYGERVVVCIRTRPRSPERTPPSNEPGPHEEAIVVTAPDALVPIIEVTDIDVTDAFGAVAVEVLRGQGAVDGTACGGRWLEVVEGPEARLDDVQRPCDAVTDAAWHARDVAAPNVVIRTRLTSPSGRIGSTTLALPVRPQRCQLGDAERCAARPDEWYRVPLNSRSTTTTLCARGTLGGRCDVDQSTAAGRAVVRVRYVPTAEPGTLARSGWTRAAARADSRPLLIDAPTWRPADPAAELGVVRGTLRSDRPTLWEVEVDDTCRISEEQRFFSADEPTDRLTLELSGLCPGVPTDLEATLTDPETAEQSTWTPRTGWQHGRVTASTPRERLVMTITATPPARSTVSRWSLDAEASMQIQEPGWQPLGAADRGTADATVRHALQPIGLGRGPESIGGVRQDPCVTTFNSLTNDEGLHRIALEPEIETGARMRIQVRVHLQEADPPATGRIGCRLTGRVLTAHLVAVISADELRSEGGVLLRSSGGDASPSITAVVRTVPLSRR